MSWFDQQAERYPELAILTTRPIAYFCFEYAVDPRLPIYSGGLGVLAGDFLKEASDMGLPVVAVGLLYKQSYFTQRVDEAGKQVEDYHLIDPAAADVQRVLNDKGEPLNVTVKLPDRSIVVAIWRYLVGSINLYLLDSDLEENTVEDRMLTQRLYRGEPNTRLLQEIILGLGGQHALSAMGIRPVLYHMNEGHSAFLYVGLIHHYIMEHGLELPDAMKRAKTKIVFTNHTLVPAGHDLFLKKFVKERLAVCDENRCIPIDKIIEMGTLPNNPEVFGTTELALAISAKINAVSRAHAEHAEHTWPNAKFISITNGVHAPTFAIPELRDLIKGDPEQIKTLDNHRLWAIHEQAKARLAQAFHHGTNQIFGKNTLMVSWARRFALYKQPLILFSDISRLKKIIDQANGKIVFIIAGKAHPQDDGGKAIIEELHFRIREHDLTKNVIFVPNYSLELAKLLIQGSDVWLNTPVHAQEACGTSGMKAGLNGVLNCSTPGGWVREVAEEEIGWLISELKTADHLYERLETEVISLYNKRIDGLPVEWIEKMKKLMYRVWSDYTATRMLTQYTHELYRPVIREQTEINY